ncbi:MAG: methyltransferase domain-containing protein [Thermotogae bacterium]|nr:methyltransferase domain-containing protein [Thermotogota bacterium]MCP5465475.1 methyltransferase domain-containing protein [Thermotogota bacterium]HOO74899.1 methyltransferase domain-containing protein [Tepiditoga sp.]
MKSYEYYDNISSEYDEMYEDYYWKSHNDMIKNYIERFTKDLCGNSLDIGCGTGTWSKLLSDMGFKSYGFDPSEKMVKISADKVKNGIFSRGFIETFSYDIKFDVITAVGDILSYCEDYFQGIYNVFCHLKKNGVFIGTTDSIGRFASDSFYSERLDITEKLKYNRYIEIGMSEKLSFRSKLFSSEELGYTLKSLFRNVRIYGIMPFPFEENKNLYKYSGQLKEVEKKYGDESFMNNYAEHLLFVCKK